MRTDPIKQLKSSRRRRSKGSAGTDLSGHAPAAAELERGGFRPAGLLLNRKGSVHAVKGLYNFLQLYIVLQYLIEYNLYTFVRGLSTVD